MRALLAGVLASAVLAVPGRSLELVTLASKSPLVKLKVMIRAGSADDPAGKEGAASILSAMLVEGSFGDPKDPVTKDKLAELTRPWGTGAYPSSALGKQTLVFSFSVPKDAVREYIEKVVRPMFNQPLFDAKELERIRGESLQALTSSLRLEQIENLGLTAVDNVEFEGTPFAHPDLGTEQGLKSITRDDLQALWKRIFTPGRLVLGLSSDDKTLAAAFVSAFPAGGGEEKKGQAQLKIVPVPFSGRSALIIALPSAISTGIHAAFPLDVTRKDPDYWPLYVGNIWFGTHRDSFSHLYQVLREERGYNYGDYSYIEHFEGRPAELFPPSNYPREKQYLSIWVRPVAHAYAPHVVKAITWELEHFIRDGLTDEQCGLAKTKAKVLYLSLAETTEKLLASRLDDKFYRLAPGYLDSYLKNVDAVRCADVNAAIRRHLQSKDLEYVIVTDKAEAPKIAEALASNAPSWGKQPADYQIDVRDEHGKKIYIVPEPKLDLLRLDAAWAWQPLELPIGRIRVVPVEKLFQTASLP